MIRLTLCVDLEENPPFISEFGLSLLLEYRKTTFLLDTGAGAALKENLALLKESGAYRNVILTHGHYDHTGGLKDLLPGRIFCGKKVAQPHYSLHADGVIHPIAMPEDSKAVLTRSAVQFVEHFTQIAPGLFLTGPIPRSTTEDCGGNFFHDEACISERDLVEEELALLTEEGVLITGCCHAGLMNTILYCEKMCPGVSIRTVAGGLHLRNASAERLEETAAFLRDREIKKLLLMHCTGENAVQYLENALPECRVLTMKTGETLEL